MRSTRHDPPSRRLSVGLVCSEGHWPHDDRPAADDPYLSLGDTEVDVVVLRCGDPSASLGELRDATGADSVLVIVISPRRDTEAVVEVFRGGAGHLVEGD